MASLIMILSAALIILMVKFGLLRGIDGIANAMKWTAKTRGQVTGYATSVPEFVCLVASGLAGVWEAGLWNIASSNIINAFLMTGAVLYYRQSSELRNRRFVDEVGFALAAIAVPIVLMTAELDTDWRVIPILLGFFAIYRFTDKRVNARAVSEAPASETVGNLRTGLILVVTALAVIGVLGVFLGNATANVVEQLGIHPALAGWILGLVTSIPEMVSFFSVYSSSKKAGRLQSLEDTQEALDNLTGSNMANVGIVYPIGLLAYLLVRGTIG
ncbi:MAG: Ca2+/Na+ antiporter [Planctomycetota bacterium]|jgi:Ca2+/Na+ antiporter